MPAIVLVHAGGRKSSHDWVKIGNDRSYVAISISLEGHIPIGQGSELTKHDYSG